MPIAERELQNLLDKQALSELNIRYARGVDRKDYPLLRELYHRDAIDDHGSHFCGPAGEFIDWLENVMPGIITQHFLGNMLFALDGDRAEGEIQAIRYHVVQGNEGPIDLIQGGRYLDKYVREQGRWYFLHRTVTQEWEHSRASTDPHAAVNLAAVRAAPDELSYRLLGLLSGAS